MAIRFTVRDNKQTNKQTKQNSNNKQTNKKQTHKQKRRRSFWLGSMRHRLFFISLTGSVLAREEAARSYRGVAMRTPVD